MIGLPFTKNEAFPDAQQQLNKLGKKVLLFLQNLSILEIHSPEGYTKWKIDRKHELITVESNESEFKSRQWRVIAEKGKIPTQYLREDQLTTPDYEIKLAIPEDDHVLGFLFNYFSTQVRFPFPVIVHATMEITTIARTLWIVRLIDL